MSGGAAQAPSFDATDFRKALGRFPTGVVIVTARTLEGRPLGLTISSFNSVSLAPPLVLWSLARTSRALPTFETIERYAIHVLAADQAGVARQFAAPGVADRFAGIEWAPNAHGVPRLAGAAAWFECFNRSRYVEGDHVILVAEIEHCGHEDRMPLVFHAGGFQLTPTMADEPDVASPPRTTSLTR